MPKTTEYTIIAIYSGSVDSENAVSSLEGVPGYLHLHAIRKDELARLPDLADVPEVEDSASPQTIYQWGLSSDKDLGVRAPLV